MRQCLDSYGSRYSYVSNRSIYVSYRPRIIRVLYSVSFCLTSSCSLVGIWLYMTLHCLETVLQFATSFKLNFLIIPVASDGSCRNNFPTMSISSKNIFWFWFILYPGGGNQFSCIIMIALNTILLDYFRRYRAGAELHPYGHYPQQDRRMRPNNSNNRPAPQQGSNYVQWDGGR